MIILKASLRAWNTESFSRVFRKEVATLDETVLPLQQGLSHSHLADGSNLSVLLLKCSETKQALVIKSGVFYHGFISGCNCSDDPNTIEPQTEYCEILFKIDKETAITVVSLLII
ncbi:MAG: hypothetical protein KAG28_02710 [Cocleimonas sp.]|nr:hypothetical protein [Cocleimonas sp.]